MVCFNIHIMMPPYRLPLICVVQFCTIVMPSFEKNFMKSPKQHSYGLSSIVPFTSICSYNVLDDPLRRILLKVANVRIIKQKS